MPVNHRQKVTIKDIARACSVSTQTISRVVNQRPDVAPETRRRVEKAIAEMGYRPSALARSLVQQRSRTLGVIIAGLRYVGVSQTLNGITEACEAAGYALLVKELASFTTPNIAPVIDALIARHVEGIIFAAPEINENIKIVQSQLPSFCPEIIFLKSQPNPNYFTICVDNAGGVRAAADYLLRLGRRHIGLISGPLEWLEARQRKQGWEEALKNVGIEPGPEMWANGNWSSASGEAAFAELIRKYPLMDAVIASNDQMALGVLHYCHKNGIRVPADLAVIGFDNLAESAFFSPALTTLTHPLREMGALAVNTLLEMIAGSSRPENVLTLHTQLVVRESTPAPSYPLPERAAR